MKKLILVLGLLVGLSSAASAGTVVDQLVWEASPIQIQKLEQGILGKKGYFVTPSWYTYDIKTKLCFAQTGHSRTVVPCTDLVIKQIIEDYSK